MLLLMVRPEVVLVQPWLSRFVLFRKTCVSASSSPLSAMGMQEFQTPERMTARCCALERSMKAASVMPMIMLINSVTTRTLPAWRAGQGGGWSFMGGQSCLRRTIFAVWTLSVLTAWPRMDREQVQLSLMSLAPAALVTTNWSQVFDTLLRP